MDRDRIVTYYSNARELVKQNKPKEARAYVLVILNCAVQSYYSTKKLLLKAKTAAFLDKWIAVSRELYDKGVTDYVLTCFGLPTKQEQQLPSVKPGAAPEKPEESDPPVSAPGEQGDDIDIAGIIDESAKSQGWCADVFERNKAAVVEISIDGPDSVSTGTGFIISPKGYVLTNHHVVSDDGAGDSTIAMKFAGKMRSHSLTLIDSDRSADLALCKFSCGKVKDFGVVKRIADYARVKQGADCLVVGNAFGMGLAPFSGVVRFSKNEIGDLVYTAPANPGDSGAPVFNRQGECIGINKSKTFSVNDVAAEGYANATPMDKIDALLNKWCKKHNITL